MDGDGDESDSKMINLSDSFRFPLFFSPMLVLHSEFFCNSSGAARGAGRTQYGVNAL